MMLPEGWEKIQLAKLGTITSGGTPSRKNPLFWNGDIPWVTTAELAQAEIYSTNECITRMGIENSASKLFPIDTILIAMYGKGKTRGTVAKLKCEATTNQACAAIFNLQCHTDFLYQNLSSRYIELRGLSNGGSQDNLSLDLIKKIEVLLPPLAEQKKIAEILSTWDAAISVVDKQLENCRQQKKALMQQLLTGKRRLSGFGGEWRKVKLRTLLKEEGPRNKGNKVTRVLSVTKHSGVIPPEEQFSKHVASENTSTYKIIRKGQFGYNPSRLNVGSFGRLERFEEGILSPLYVVFSVNEYLLSSDYFLTWMSSDEAMQKIKSSTQGSVRDSVNFDALSAFTFLLSPLEEQIAIAQLFNSSEKEISLLEQKKSLLTQEKKALIQQLLTGKKRIAI